MLLFFSAAILSADTYYVATDGDDSNSGATPSNAWATLSHALSTVPSGSAANPSVVSIAEGTYVGDSASASDWTMSLASKNYVHIKGQSAGNTIFTRGSLNWTTGTILTFDGGQGNMLSGIRFSLDTHPTAWSANVIKLNNPNGIVISNVWIDGPMTPPADRVGRRFNITGSVGADDVLITHSCISGGGLGFRIEANGAPNGNITLRHMTFADFTTTQLDDRWVSFDQRTGSDAAAVKVQNCLFYNLFGGLRSDAVSNGFTCLYSATTNGFNGVDQWFQKVGEDIANITVSPSFFTLADGTEYVTSMEKYGWVYSPPITNNPPVITYPSDGSDIVAMTGTPLSITVTATDSDTPQSNLVFSATSLPPGAVFSNETHTLYWDNPLPGVYSGLRFTVSDTESADSATVNIYVRGGEIQEYYVSPTGIDHPGRDAHTPASAWKTLTFAVDNAEKGTKYDHNIIHMTAGTFAGEASGLHGQANNWHIDLGNAKYLDIIGAGADQTHITRGTRDVFASPVSEILLLQGAEGIGLKNFSLTLNVTGGTPTTGFDYACIKINNSDDIILDSLYLSGPTNNTARNGHAVYAQGTAAGKCTMHNCLVEGFSQGFYTTSYGGYEKTNLISWSTFVNLDGSTSFDDGVGVWTRANSDSMSPNALVIEHCVFAHLPAAGTNTAFGVGIKNDSTDNMDFWGNILTYSSSNLFYQTTLMYAPDLPAWDGATNDVVMNPEFYVNALGLPYVSTYDFGWNVIPEPTSILFIILLICSALRMAK